MPKIPPDVQLRIAREHPGEVWKMEDILATLKIEVEAREASSLNKVMLTKGSIQRPINPTASSLVASNQTPRCVYCDGEHYSSSCNAVRDVKDRHAALLCTGRCFNCLRTRHRAKDCDIHKRCRHCRKIYL